jgi:hypothetical protein
MDSEVVRGKDWRTNAGKMNQCSKRSGKSDQRQRRGTWNGRIRRGEEMAAPHQLKGHHPLTHSYGKRARQCGDLQEKVLFSAHCTDGIDVSVQKARRGIVVRWEKKRPLGRHADERHR